MGWIFGGGGGDGIEEKGLNIIDLGDFVMKGENVLVNLLYFEGK
jgi:hypothetical protein